MRQVGMQDFFLNFCFFFFFFSFLICGRYDSFEQISVLYMCTKINAYIDAENVVMNHASLVVSERLEF